MRPFDHVSFDPACPVWPTGLAATGWKTSMKASAGTHYHFDAAGQLRRQEPQSDLVFVTHDASGSFILYTLELGGACYREHRATFFDGLLVSVEPLREASDVQGFIDHPTWVIADAAGLTVDAAMELHNVPALITLIRAAQRDPALKADARSSELMLGLALCQPDRLGEMSPRDALRSLNKSQRQALINWDH